MMRKPAEVALATAMNSFWSGLVLRGVREQASLLARRTGPLQPHTRSRHGRSSPRSLAAPCRLRAEGGPAARPSQLARLLRPRTASPARPCRRHTTPLVPLVLAPLLAPRRQANLRSRSSSQRRLPRQTDYCRRRAARQTCGSSQQPLRPLRAPFACLAAYHFLTSWYASLLNFCTGSTICSCTNDILQARKRSRHYTAAQPRHCAVSAPKSFCSP
jgi:hypothetical protein